jgi:phage shock protein PspC (stress-responsive transcriptional regulator)
MVRGTLPRDREAMSETPPPSSPDPADEAPTEQAPLPSPRRLLRSRDDRVLGGVCGGLARYFNIDPLIVRIAAIALTFAGGVAVIAYIAALLLVPDDDGTGHPVPGKPGRVSTIVGAVVIVLAGVALLEGQWGFGFGWAFGALAPTVLIITILAIAGQRLLAGRGETQPTAARIAGAALVLSAVILGVLVVAAGGAFATAAGGGAAVAGVVILLGIVMVAFSFRDRRVRWLALPALALAIPSGVVAAAGVDVDHGVGDRHYTPATVADLRAGGYELGIGELEVDLRDMQWPAGAPVRLKVDVGTGHALVLVPQDVCVQADTHAGLGYVGLLGHSSGGADVDEQDGTVRRTVGRRLILDADMGIGAVEVRHRRGNDHWDDGPHSTDRISNDLADAGAPGRGREPPGPRHPAQRPVRRRPRHRAPARPGRPAQPRLRLAGADRPVRRRPDPARRRPGQARRCLMANAATPAAAHGGQARRCVMAGPSRAIMGP